MSTINLKPIRERSSDFDAIELAIIRLFRKEIYIPLMKSIEAPVSRLNNAREDLLDAIKSGQITYHLGYFTGRFNSLISKELKKIGAEWERRREAFYLPKYKMEMDVKYAIAVSEERLQQTFSRIDLKLSEIAPEEVASKLMIERMFDDTLWRVEDQFQKSIKNITVTPKLTPEARKRIASEYTSNMQLYIQDWAKNEIIELRQRVQERAVSGMRYEGLIKEIESSYGSSQSKAKFLARQETALMMAKFRQVRYQEAGSEEYVWTCVKMPHQSKGAPYLPGEVRYYHAQLDGKIVRWDSPPVVDSKGNRKHAGCDYGCRCYPIARIKF